MLPPRSPLQSQGRCHHGARARHHACAPLSAPPRPIAAALRPCSHRLVDALSVPCRSVCLSVCFPPSFLPSLSPSPPHFLPLSQTNSAFDTTKAFRFRTPAADMRPKPKLHRPRAVQAEKACPRTNVPEEGVCLRKGGVPLVGRSVSNLPHTSIQPATYKYTHTYTYSKDHAPGEGTPGGAEAGENMMTRYLSPSPRACSVSCASAIAPNHTDIFVSL